MLSIDANLRDGQHGLLLGLSGGLDSTVLLHLLASDSQCRARLRAVHVNHQLHADAPRWAEHCATQCRALSVPLQIIPVSVSKDSGQGLEASARAARYAAFASHINTDETLLLAHHQDDQAETILLRLLRGASADGLAAMSTHSDAHGFHVQRPLLNFSREELENYARHHRLSFIDDPSNIDTSLDRNFLRHQVLPLMMQRWPQAKQSLSQSAQLLHQQNRALLERDAQLLAQVQPIDPQTLDWPGLLRLSAYQRARVIRLWLRQLQVPMLPKAAHAEIETSFRQGSADRTPRFDWNGYSLIRWNDTLYVGRTLLALPDDLVMPWSGESALALPHGASLRIEGGACFEPAVLVRSRQGGENIRLEKRAHQSSLKKLLQSEHIPPWERAQLPLIFNSDNELLAAGDLIISEQLAKWLDSHQSRLVWQPPTGLRLE